MQNESQTLRNHLAILRSLPEIKPCQVPDQTLLPPPPAHATDAREAMTGIQDIQLIGKEVAIKWTDDSEDFYAMDRLRALSPSAETQGEKDLLGNPISGDQIGKDFSGVSVTGWNPVGGYGIQFHFSDGHNTGIFTFEYLKDIASEVS